MGLSQGNYYVIGAEIAQNIQGGLNTYFCFAKPEGIGKIERE